MSTRRIRYSGSSLRPRCPRVSFWVRRRTSSRRWLARLNHVEGVCYLQSVGQHLVVGKVVRAGHVQDGPADPVAPLRRLCPEPPGGAFSRLTRGLCRSVGDLRHRRQRCTTALVRHWPFRQNKVSSTPTAWTWPTREVSASNSALPQRATSLLTVCQSQPSSVATSPTGRPPRPTPDGCPPSRSRGQQSPHRPNRGVLFDERADPTVGIRARPAPFQPPQPHRPAERRQVYQHHRPIPLGPHPSTTALTHPTAPAGADHHHKRGSLT